MAGGIRLQVEDPQRWVEESPRRGLGNSPKGQHRGDSSSCGDAAGGGRKMEGLSGGVLTLLGMALTALAAAILSVGEALGVLLLFQSALNQMWLQGFKIALQDRRRFYVDRTAGGDKYHRDTCFYPPARLG